MNHSHALRAILTSLFVAAITLLSSQTLAASGQHLTLKGTNGKTYSATTDASGIFIFTDVEPGTYKLIWVLPDGTTPQNTQSAKIEITSFSWGETASPTLASTMSDYVRGRSSSTPPTPKPMGLVSGTSNAQGKSTPVTRSNISNNRSGSELQVSGSECFTVLLEDVVISSVTTVTGTVSACTITPSSQTSGK
ncbi:MAG TPA: hypothetical protein VFO76_00445 [Candidatus Kapabacteria bacterium]|nr:hypothetical protein [Candidatus Kapabacteria bacterium]